MLRLYQQQTKKEFDTKDLIDIAEEQLIQKTQKSKKVHKTKPKPSKQIFEEPETNQKKQLSTFVDFSPNSLNCYRM
jgi:hypothetical protein